jgi:mono/diheme cytochrome c family protein
MKNLRGRLSFQVRNLLPALLIIPAVVILLLLVSHKTVEALPEYAARTGEPCAVCHVSAGGGGPRTMRGLLWAAKGKPDKVPELPGVMIAPGVNDGVDLYQIACGGCHGLKGEGLSAMGLANTKIGQGTIRDFTLHGIPQLGMPSFEGLFTDDQINTLVTYVTGLSSGEIPPPPDFYHLPPPILICAEASDNPACNFSATESGGN